MKEHDDETERRRQGRRSPPCVAPAVRSTGCDQNLRAEMGRCARARKRFQSVVNSVSFISVSDPPRREVPAHQFACAGYPRFHGADPAVECLCDVAVRPFFDFVHHERRAELERQPFECRAHLPLDLAGEKPYISRRPHGSFDAFSRGMSSFHRFSRRSSEIV